MRLDDPRVDMALVFIFGLIQAYASSTAPAGLVGPRRERDGGKQHVKWRMSERER